MLFYVCAVTALTSAAKALTHILDHSMCDCLSVLLFTGNGVVVHIPTLLEEMKDLKEAGIDFEGRLKLSDRAHIVFDFHQQIDG
jgi:adenylosuccinate synthase